MSMRERLGEESWWNLNLATHGVGGVLMNLLGRMRLWKNIRKFWGLFLVIPNLRWEMTPRLDFDIFRGVGIRPLKKLFHIYVVLLV